LADTRARTNTPTCSDLINFIGGNMKGSTRIAGAVLAGLGTWLLAGYFQGIMRQRRGHANKKLAKEAVQSWEGEGGALHAATPSTAR
jgi:hypothetical protein